MLTYKKSIGFALIKKTPNGCGFALRKQAEREAQNIFSENLINEY